jgi:hypothetical protein
MPLMGMELWAAYRKEEAMKADWVKFQVQMQL